MNKNEARLLSAAYTEEEGVWLLAIESIGNLRAIDRYHYYNNYYELDLGNFELCKKIRNCLWCLDLSRSSPSGLRDGILSSFLERPIFVGINNNNSNNKFDSNQIQNPLKYLCTLAIHTYYNNTHILKGI